MNNLLKKLSLLPRLAMRNPQEFLDRVEMIVVSRFDARFAQRGEYEARSIDHILTVLQSTLAKELNGGGVEDIEHDVRARMDILEQEAPFNTKHHGDFGLARVCYAACRLLRPEIVVETGVAYGVTTAFVLKALQVNGQGRLFSVDLPPLGRNADVYVGYLVPEDLREKWVLHRGVSKHILPKLLSRLGKVDLFIHDSLHTYRNIRWELQAVTPYLSRPAIVVADDIQGNKAFFEWVHEVQPTYWAAFRQEAKDAMGGIAVFK